MSVIILKLPDDLKFEITVQPVGPNAETTQSVLNVEKVAATEKVAAIPTAHQPVVSSKQSLTVICHFFNNEALMPFWLRNTVPLFDHGIMINYFCTDRSIDIIREMAPTWEIRNTRNITFNSDNTDDEVMDIERGVTGWKACLNVPEILVHYDLRGYLAKFEEQYPDEMGVCTSGFHMFEHEKTAHLPIDHKAPGQQIYFTRLWGLHERDVQLYPNEWGKRHRLIHRAKHGCYKSGRHRNHITEKVDPELFLFWYGMDPMWVKLKYNDEVKKAGKLDGPGMGHHGWCEANVHDWHNSHTYKASWLNYYQRVNDMLEKIKQRDEGNPVAFDGKIALIERSEVQAVWEQFKAEKTKFSTFGTVPKWEQ